MVLQLFFGIHSWSHTMMLPCQLVSLKQTWLFLCQLLSLLFACEAFVTDKVLQLTIIPESSGTGLCQKKEALATTVILCHSKPSLFAATPQGSYSKLSDPAWFHTVPHYQLLARQHWSIPPVHKNMIWQGKEMMT